VTALGVARREERELRAKVMVAEKKSEDAINEMERVRKREREREI
jgi:hypothetical protein